MKQIPDNSVDCIITDPPYGIGYKSEHRTIEFPHMANDTEEEARELLDKALAIAVRKLKEGSHVYVFSGCESLGWMIDSITKHFTFKKDVIWRKNNWTPGDLAGNYASRHEHIIYAWKGQRLLNGRRDRKSV